MRVCGDCRFDATETCESYAVGGCGGPWCPPFIRIYCYPTTVFGSRLALVYCSWVESGIHRNPVRLMRHWFRAFILVLSIVPGVGAQTVRGLITRADGSSASGAVVLLVRVAGDSVVARGVASASGHFVLRTTAAGPFLLRVLQVGQRPTTVGPFTVARDAEHEERVVLAHRPVVLAIMDVRARNECRTNPDTGQRVAQLLLQARTALLASVVNTSDGEMRAEYRLYARTEDRQRRALTPDAEQTVTRATATPFASLPPDSIRTVGYVESVGDSVMYRGPDAEILLSDAFASSHCFQLAHADSSRPSLVGVQFRPTTNRRGVVDIRGTIWMDRQSYALQVVEFLYEPITDDERRVGVGGEVVFAQTTAGAWFVSEWLLRMPRTVVRRIPPVLGRYPRPARLVQTVEGVRVVGGNVRELHVGGVPQFVATTVATTSGATFTTPNGTTSTAVAAAVDASDSFVLAFDTTPCGVLNTKLDIGVVRRRVLDAAAGSVADATVRVTWREQYRIYSNRFTWRTTGVQTRSSDGGEYALCTVPIGIPVTVSAERGDRRAAPQTVRLTVGTRVMDVSPMLDVRGVLAATVTVRVIRVNDDSVAKTSANATVNAMASGVENGVERGVEGADVIVQTGSVSRTVRTDRDGLVRVPDLPIGDAQVQVRRIGLAAHTMQLTLVPGDNELTVPLTAATVALDTMRIRATASARSLATVDERIRLRTANANITRDQFERRSNPTVSQLLRMFAGVQIADSGGTTVAVSSRGGRYVNGELVPCVMRVMVDGVVLAGAPNVDAVIPLDVHAIEVFYGPSRVPPQLGPSEAQCGIVAIWTRRD